MADEGTIEQCKVINLLLIIQEVLYIPSDDNDCPLGGILSATERRDKEYFFLRHTKGDSFT